MSFDYLLRNGRIAGSDWEKVDIGVRGGKIEAIARSLEMAHDSTRVIDIEGRVLLAGFVETHIHLDKACISDRCSCKGGDLKDVISAVTQAKQHFTEDDIYQRGKRAIEKAIVQGTMRMRTHVEVDPRIGLKGFDAVSRLKRDFAWAMNIELCVFPQEGLLNDPGCDALLVEACEKGADTIGGVPYVDTNPVGQISRIFELAKRYDIDIDFHLDFDLDPSWMHLDEVCRQTEKYGWGGRVAIGHVSKLSALEPDSLAAVGRRLADAGVAVTVLPATDLYLMGRDRTHLVPRGVAPVHRLVEFGVTSSISTNNILNPFTPFGDCSQIRMANLYANVSQIGQPADFMTCLALVTTLPAKLMNIADYGIAVGNPADIVSLDCTSPEAAVAELAQPLFGIKRGRMSFSRPAAELYSPAGIDRPR